VVGVRSDTGTDVRDLGFAAASGAGFHDVAGLGEDLVAGDLFFGACP
jgi:hypothetical protein